MIIIKILRGQGNINIPFNGSESQAIEVAGAISALTEYMVCVQTDGLVRGIWHLGQRSNLEG